MGIISLGSDQDTVACTMVTFISVTECGIFMMYMDVQVKNYGWVVPRTTGQYQSQDEHNQIQNASPDSLPFITTVIVPAIFVAVSFESLVEMVTLSIEEATCARLFAVVV